MVSYIHGAEYELFYVYILLMIISLGDWSPEGTQRLPRLVGLSKALEMMLVSFAYSKPQEALWIFKINCVMYTCNACMGIEAFQEVFFLSGIIPLTNINNICYLYPYIVLYTNSQYPSDK